jgi:signal transduction histidine kinase
MATTTAGRPPRRLVAGVALRIARRTRIDPLLVRLAFVVTTLAGGLGVPLYLVAWVVLGGEGDPRLRTGRGAVEVAAGAGLLVLAALLTMRATGLWISDALTWPLVLAAAGGALIWRTSLLADGTVAPERPRERARAAPAAGERAGWAAAAVSRTGVGVALVFAAAVVFLQATGALAAARDVALAAIVVAIALGVIFAPWIVRLVRSLDAERAARIRSQERAEVAAHLHDSVLQTLALVQRRSDEPAQVAALARRQERELRAWLAGSEPGGGEWLRAALEAVAEEVEDAHGAAVDVVVVGDAPLDERGAALVAAAGEAVLNAACHGGGAVSVYAEVAGGRATVFVRDRGPGFDPGAVPADRHGIRESIVGRMERHGGRAIVRSAPGDGTEVELTL